MNIQQLEYILAVNRERHFVKAAESCFVTQATLSMMIKKLEEELEVQIFDRSRQPVTPTAIGQTILDEAEKIVRLTKNLKELVKEEQGTITGELRLGIIPTLAPQLLPLFTPGLLKKFPQLKLKISELTTEQILLQLERGSLDIGILASPLNKAGMREMVLFYEQFVVFASNGEKVLKKKYILSEDIDINRLWLLEEGHCMRSQTINLCSLKEREKAVHQLDFESGSIETLKKIVESNKGITILPELAIADLTKKQKELVRYFKSPAPVREISMVTYGDFHRKKLLDALKLEICRSVPESMLSADKKEIIPHFE